MSTVVARLSAAWRWMFVLAVGVSAKLAVGRPRRVRGLDRAANRKYSPRSPRFEPSTMIRRADPAPDRGSRDATDGSAPPCCPQDDHQARLHTRRERRSSRSETSRSRRRPVVTRGWRDRSSGTNASTVKQIRTELATGKRGSCARRRPRHDDPRSRRTLRPLATFVVRLIDTGKPTAHFAGPHAEYAQPTRGPSNAGTSTSWPGSVRSRPTPRSRCETRSMNSSRHTSADPTGRQAPHSFSPTQPPMSSRPRSRTINARLRTAPSAPARSSQT